MMKSVENIALPTEMVCGSKKKKVHSETSTPPVAASILPRTSPSPAATSPVETSTLPITASILLGMSPSSEVAASPPVPAPSSQGVVDSRILILSTADSFNKQSDCAKLITEIMKAHFVEVHPSFGKVSDRIKNMCYTEFGMAQQNWLHGSGGQGLGKHTGRSRYFIEWWDKMGKAFAQSTFMSYCIKLKSNAKRLHIETDSPIQLTSS
ncbi:hypothetical protein M9H77_19197 [Catharanthus roseus]|uniref:Uncharacterized protein n=1 Tax=Catharanthus roseus TaxID=4058 RepID=A0ACC0B9M1_CATRO|nr:hypothetical protein M9H77_19197 [Catharanthus roseus]